MVFFHNYLSTGSINLLSPLYTLLTITKDLKWKSDNIISNILNSNMCNSHARFDILQGVTKYKLTCCQRTRFKPHALVKTPPTWLESTIDVFTFPNLSSINFVILDFFSFFSSSIQRIVHSSFINIFFVYVLVHKYKRTGSTQKIVHSSFINVFFVKLF